MKTLNEYIKESLLGNWGDINPMDHVLEDWVNDKRNITFDGPNPIIHNGVVNFPLNNSIKYLCPVINVYKPIPTGTKFEYDDGYSVSLHYNPTQNELMMFSKNLMHIDVYELKDLTLTYTKDFIYRLNFPMDFKKFSNVKIKLDTGCKDFAMDIRYSQIKSINDLDFKLNKQPSTFEVNLGFTQLGSSLKLGYDENMQEFSTVSENVLNHLREKCKITRINLGSFDGRNLFIQRPSKSSHWVTNM